MPVRALAAGLGRSCAPRSGPRRASRASRLRSMSPVRAALLALCTLLAGAGIGYGAANVGGSGTLDGGHDGDDGGGRAGGRDRRRRAPAGRPSRPASRTRRSGAMQRAFKTIVDAQNPAVALDDLDALYKTDTYVRRTCHPLAHEIGHLAFAKYKSVTVAERIRARDLLVGLPPRADGELHRAVRRRPAAHAHERRSASRMRATPTRSRTTTAGTASATG